MQKGQHRIRKHEMKEDSFVTFAFRAQEYLQTHQRPFYIGLGIIVVAVAALWLFSASGQRAEVAANQTLTDAFIRVQQNDLAGAAATYERLIDEYGGTQAAREGLFFLANLHFVQRQWPEAIDAYRRYIERHAGFDPGRTAAAWAAIGDAQQAEGDHEAALDSYGRALSMKGSTYIKGNTYVAACRSALAISDTTEALRLADALLELQGNSQDMTRLREMLAMHGVLYTRGF